MEVSSRNIKMSTMDYEDTHENISDAEPDSDHEDADDAQKLLGTWLGELENLKLIQKKRNIKGILTPIFVTRSKNGAVD
ncbi:hypothetical protein HNY73_002936 [Argiope bruennichi]|uniref:Uncharacterized protein n=1 Tax=Argiope bruennichi TaxID=94029 RepID=A0A8T0FXX7_ARGBR|nr:hypothetical protein HNY73_002936 [Argiope bruennichi]